MKAFKIYFLLFCIAAFANSLLAQSTVSTTDKSKLSSLPTKQATVTAGKTVSTAKTVYNKKKSTTKKSTSSRSSSSTTQSSSTNPSSQGSSTTNSTAQQRVSTPSSTSGSSNTTTNSNNGRQPTSTTTNTTNNTNGNVVSTITNTVLGTSSGGFSESDAANAIKEALLKGVTTGVSKVSVTDGYFGNSMIKIPFPQDAQIVESTLRSVGMGSMIDQVVKSLNRAAESAASQAAPIFVNGIKQMTINDAINIVSNKQSDAATRFLERTTTESLVVAFKPSIKTALDKTLATKYWGDVMNYYNKIPFVQKVNPDLTDFVTRKAISGLFYMIAQEEAKIRKDPVARTSDILQKVFGNIKF